MFYDVAEAGGFRQAQRQTGLSLETIRRRVSALEKALGGKLFRRTNTGLHLTDLCKETFEKASAARESIDSIRRVTRRAKPSGGLVSISVPEGMGIFWLTPRLKEFKERYPEVVLDFTSTMRLADINQNEADITIQYAKPAMGNLIQRRLATLHNIFYCSPEYEAQYGLPKNFDDLQNHKIAYQSSDQIDEAVFLSMIDMPDPSGVVQYRVNSSFALYQLARTGNVLAALPSYVSALHEDLIPIDFGGISYPIDIWLSYHPDVNDFAPARSLLDWIIENFDNEKFPWFRAKYVRANELEKLDFEAWRINMGQFIRK